MPIKLQVVKEGAEGADPADYLFEQERITIGRGSDNDLTIPDQKVSKQHAEIRQEGGDYRLFDRESKNHTFIGDSRVGEEEPYVLKSGDVIRVGDFKIEFVPLFMPSSEQTAFADVDDDANPFAKHASQLANALKGLAETYTYAPAEKRDEELEAAMNSAIDEDTADNEVVQRLISRMSPSGGDGAAPESRSSASHLPEASSEAPAGQAGTGEVRTPSTPEHVDEVMDMLLESVARMISIPTHFWREFSGNTVVQPPEKSFLHRADVSSLREHLLAPDVGTSEREQRVEHLREAVNTLVAHNVAMLAGYKKSVMAGSKELLHSINPTDAYEDAKGGGGISGFFGGGDRSSSLERLHRDWRRLHSKEWGALEKELFRPTYVDAYLDRMAEAWDVDKSEIVEER